MGIGSGALPPCNCHCRASKQGWRMWQDKVKVILWGGQCIPSLWWDSAHASYPLLSPQCNGKLQPYVSSLFPTRLMHPSVSLKTNFEILMRFQGCSCSAVTVQEWAGQEISTYRLRAVEVCPGPPTYKSAHTWPYRWDPAFPRDTACQRKHQQQTRMLATEISLL